MRYEIAQKERKKEKEREIYIYYMLRFMDNKDVIMQMTLNFMDSYRSRCNKAIKSYIKCFIALFSLF